MEPSISASANVSLPKEPPLYEGRVNRAAFEVGRYPKALFFEQ